MLCGNSIYKSSRSINVHFIFSQCTFCNEQSVSRSLAVYISRLWMPSDPVPWVPPCWRGHAPSLQPRPRSNARPQALRAWSWSGAKTPATRTPVPCSPTTWSTHYRWRTRTTGGVNTQTILSILLLHHCLPHGLDWEGVLYFRSHVQGKGKIKSVHLRKQPKFCLYCTLHYISFQVIHSSYIPYTLSISS